MINQKIYKKTKDYETAPLFTLILAFFLDYVPTVTSCVQHVVIDEDSLVNLYVFNYPNPRPVMLTAGHVFFLEQEINKLADKVKLTQEEREHLLSLPNADDNRPHYSVTIVKETPDDN